MSIAEKLTTIAENMQAVYEAGKAAGGGASVPNPFEYAKSLAAMYAEAVFPDGYELTVNAPNFTGSMATFADGVKGLRKITMNVPTNMEHTAYYFGRNNSCLEEVVFPDGIVIKSANYMFTSATALRSIYGAMDISKQSSANLWQGCTALENISFVTGGIARTIEFSKCSKLTDASIQSIIDGLAEVETAQTLTFHATVGAKLTEEQKAVITAKNWTLVY